MFLNPNILIFLRRYVLLLAFLFFPIVLYASGTSNHVPDISDSSDVEYDGDTERESGDEGEESESESFDAADQAVPIVAVADVAEVPFTETNTTDEDEPQAGRRYMRRLLLGEGDFSYTVALLDKHPELSKYIFATEFDDEEALKRKHGDDFIYNIERLCNMGVEPIFGVNAMKLDSGMFEGEGHFKRIHFNCPYCENDRTHNETRRLVELFFQSVGQFQQSGERIHMVLPHESFARRQGLAYNIYASSTKAGYQYVKKRNFTRTIGDYVCSRYPGYKHVMTKGDGSSAEVLANSREHIFEKHEELLPLISEALDIARGIADQLKEYNKSIFDLKRELKEYKNKIFEHEANFNKTKELLYTKENEREVYAQEKNLFLLELIKELTGHGLENTFLFGALSPPRSPMIQVKPRSFSGLSRVVRLEECLDFLLSEKLVIYHNSYGRGYNNSAFYPLPELSTDEESSDYFSDVEGIAASMERLVLETEATSHDTDWYHDEQVIGLLQHLTEDLEGVQIINLTWEEEDSVRQVETTDDFIYFLKNRIDFTGTQTIIIPITVHAINGNFDAGNHWIGLVIDVNDGEVTTIRYVDPVGRQPSDEMIERLTEVFHGVEIISIFDITNRPQYANIVEEEQRFEGNTDDCGPFLVEVLTRIIRNNTVPYFGNITRRESRMLGRFFRQHQSSVRHEASNF